MQGPLVVAKRFHSYTDAVNANILAAGDNCSRAIVIGAILAASRGDGAIPEQWKRKTRGIAEVETLAEQIVNANPSLR